MAGSYLPPLAPRTLARCHLVLPGLAEGLLVLGIPQGPPSLSRALQATLVLGLCGEHTCRDTGYIQLPCGTACPLRDLVYLHFPGA